MKCVSCGDWDWPDEWEKLEDWQACPNCDFPVKFTGWIQQLQDKIKSLEKEVDKLNAMLDVAGAA